MLYVRPDASCIQESPMRSAKSFQIPFSGLSEGGAVPNMRIDIIAETEHAKAG
jgi:hypothetical protein